MKAEKQLSNPSVYQYVSNCENILCNLSEARNKIFSGSERKAFIKKKQIKFLIYKYKKGWWYITDSRNVINKINNLDENVVGLYPSIPHKVVLRALRQDKKDDKTIPTEELLKMAGSLLKNGYFKFGSKIKEQLSRSAIVTKYALP